MTLEFTLPEGTVFCTRCGFRPAPAPKSPEIDPLCDPCIEAMACPGFNDSCGGLRETGADLCPDCTMARLDAHSPRIPR